MTMNTYEVPHKKYILHFAKGLTYIADVGDESDWGNIQRCIPTDCKDWKESIGYGNDVDGHHKILRVEDTKENKTWVGNKEIQSWYKDCVACFVDNYSA